MEDSKILCQKEHGIPEREKEELGSWSVETMLESHAR